MKKRILSILLTVTILFTLVPSFGISAAADTEVVANNADYAEIGKDAEIVKDGFSFVNALNPEADAAVFVDDGTAVNGSTTHLIEENECATIKIPNGFKKDDNTTYDLYLRVTNMGSKIATKWNVSVTSTDSYSYITIDLYKGTTAAMYKHFLVEFWLQDDDKKITDFNLIAGECCVSYIKGWYTYYECVRPWGDDNKLYTNFDGDVQWLDGKGWIRNNSVQSLSASTDYWYTKYLFGHGSDNGTTKIEHNAYVSGNASEWVIGYIAYDVTFTSSVISFADNASTAKQTVVEGETINSIPSYTCVKGFEKNYWTADQAVTLSDGTEKAAGEKLTSDEVKKIVVTGDLNLSYAKNTDYKAITDEAEIVKDGFGFVNALNPEAGAAVFTDDGTEVNDSTTHLIKKNECATIKIPDGFKKDDNTTYDLYLRVTNMGDTAATKWNVSVTSMDSYPYITIDLYKDRNIAMYKHFLVEFWLQDGDERITDFNLIAGECCVKYFYSSYYKSTFYDCVRPWGDDNKLYTNFDGDVQWLDGKGWIRNNSVQSLSASTDYWYTKYLFGHGSDNGTTKIEHNAYVMSEASKWVIGLLDRDVTFTGSAISFADNASTAKQTVAEGETIGSIPSYTFASGFDFGYWTADQAVTLSDGTKKAAGEKLTSDEVKKIVVTGALNLTHAEDADYKAIADEAEIVKEGFNFVNALNPDAGTAVFIDGSTNTSNATVKIPKGFKAGDKTYDIYLRLMNMTNSYVTDWRVTVDTVESNSSTYLYLTIDPYNPDISVYKNFSAELWLQDGETRITDFEYSAGSCCVAGDEFVRLWSDNGKLYSNYKGNAKWDNSNRGWTSVNGDWSSSGDNWYTKYLFGHGSDDGYIKFLYNSTPTEGQSEWVIGYFTYDVTFTGDGISFDEGNNTATLTIAAEEKINSIPAYTTDSGFAVYWTVNQAVTLSDGTKKAAGTLLTSDEVKKIVVNDCLKLTATTHKHEWTYNVSEDKHSITATCGNTDGKHKDDLTETLTISAPTDLVYDGSAKTAVLSGTALSDLAVSADNITYQYKTSADGSYADTTDLTKVGYYKASITVDTDKTAYVEYSVTPIVCEMNGSIYPSISAAVTAAGTAESTIKLLSDVNENITIASNQIITLDLNGHVLKPESTKAETITVQGKLTLTDSSDTKHYLTEAATGLWVWDETETTTDAHSIIGGMLTGSTSKAAVKVEGGTFILEKGNIVGNNISETGAGVYVGSGSFEMKGGLIAGNIAQYGGGVGVCGSGSFTMTGGEISSNIANATWGCGGGVLVKETGSFNMTGGIITGNTATDKAAGVYYQDGTLTLGGTAKITGNTVGTANSNLFIVKGKYVAISTATPLKSGAEIYATLYNATDYRAEGGRFTSNGAAEDLTYFKSDIAGYDVKHNKDDYLELAVPFTASVSANIQNGTAEVSKTTAYAGDEITVTATPAEGYKLDTIYYVVEDTTEQVTITNGTFTMPAENVTVYAAFSRILEVSKEVEADEDEGITVSKETDTAIQNYVDSQKSTLTHDTSYKFAIKVEKPKDETKKTAIEEKAGTNRTVTFFEATFTKTETIDNVAQSPVEITDTGDTVLSFTIAYDMTGRCNLGVFRYHGEEATELTRVYTTANPKDGTYYVEGSGADTKVTIFASKFSTYGAGSSLIPEAVKNATYSASLTLNESIDINFTMKNLGTDGKGTGFDEDLLAITVDGEAVDSNSIKHNETENTVTCVLKEVEPKDIGTDWSIVVTYDGVQVKSFTYSVKKYCDKVFATYAENGKDTKEGKLYTLCEALLNYGKYAEDYANEVAYNESTDENKVLPAASTVNAGHVKDFGEYSFGEITPSAMKGSAGAASLSLGSTITLKYYVTTSEVLENDDPETQNFYVLNGKNEQIPRDRVTVSDGTDYDCDYVVSIELYASQLATSYTLKLKGTDTSKFCITYGVYNYCSDAQDEKDPNFTATVKTLCKAIHNYSKAVQAYIESLKN